jgi:REP element-mobilizing transposase RayT
MVAGFHLIWTAYGWWLPNDPRGSSSHEIRVQPIAELGPLHPGRKPIQPAGQEIKQFYQQARDILKHPLLTLSDEDISLVGEAFAHVIAEHRYTCYACAIMPDHVHILIRKHRDYAETMIEHLQDASRARLISAGSRAATHPVWGGPGWKVFLNTPEDFLRVIAYIRQNPIKAGRAPQHWSFVQEYDGWVPARY